MSTGERRFLVTGAHGCIGAWDGARARRGGGGGGHLRRLDRPAAARAPARRPERLERSRTSPATSPTSDAVERALDEHGITNVIHLAALQVPFCRADPPLGARVNVLGTVNIFEAVRRRLDRMAPIVYASSVAAFDAPEEGVAPVNERASRDALRRLQARERGHGLGLPRRERRPSVGLRPHTVYGVGRDQGLTSAPTTAMLAAAAGVPYRSPTAARPAPARARRRARVHRRERSPGTGDATVHNLPGPRVSDPAR